MIGSARSRIGTIAAGMLLAGVLVTVLVLWGAKPSEAAFPGVNSLIAFNSNRITTANPTGDSEIYTLDPSNPSNTLTQLTDNSTSDEGPAWSPGGQKIAFESNQDGDYEIYTMDPSNPSGTLTQLTDNTAQDLNPAFSADGQKIVFASARITPASPTGDYEIYKMDTNPATTDATSLTKNSANEFNPVWSPGGKKIAFESNRAGNAEIYTMSPNGADIKRLTKNSVVDDGPDWSPSGKKIVYESFRGVTVGFEIYVMSADGSRKKDLTNNSTARDEWPAFSPDGTQIAFSKGEEIYVMNSDGTNPTPLTNVPKRSDTLPDWQPL